LSEIYIVREFILSSLYYDKILCGGCSIWYIKRKQLVITGVAVLVGIVIIALAVGYNYYSKETSPRSPKSLVSGS